MKTKATCIMLWAFLLLTVNVFSQAPQKFNYQAVVRDDVGNIVEDQAVSIKISILEGSVGGTVVYSETHSPTTSSLGLVTLEIGGGTTSDDFTAIDWGSNTYFMKVEMDATGGTTYTEMGTSQILSVPYALHAKTVETISETDPIFGSSVAIGITEVDTSNWNNATQTISIATNKISISNGNTVTLPDGLTNVPIYTNIEILALMPENGQAIYNSTEKLYQIYNGGSWFSFPASCWPQPTTANAGTDQTFTDGTTTATLSSNIPETDHGTGSWTIINGTGGSFTDDTNPTTLFTGILHEVYTLQWTISTICGNSADNIIISFHQDGPGSTLTDIDGNSYMTVWINNQLWMAENLKTTKYNDGSDIALVTDNTEWSNLTTGAYCWYNNDEATYKNTYGALYNWNTVTTDNLCPTGWHVPTDADWTILTTYLGGESVAGGKLKETGTTHWTTPNQGATNETGFTALPGGDRNFLEGFYHVGSSGIWWSSTESSITAAYTRVMSNIFSNVGRKEHNMKHGFSVRCLKD